VATANAQCPQSVKKGSLPGRCNATTNANLAYSTCGSDETLSFATSIAVGDCFKCNHPGIKLAGYLCRDGESKLCPAGYYCPLNKTTNTYNYQLECPEGTICFGGFVSPVDCREGQLCKAGTKHIQRSWGWLVSVGFLSILLCCMCTCVCWYNVRTAKLSQQARDNYEKPSADEGHTIGEDFKKYCPAVDIEFEDVGMTLKQGGAKILSGVTGRFPAGSLIALMGPSGGGKTTFMNALLGRASYANVTGSIKVNGTENGFAKARNMMGFVPQDDILHETLTVFQNLLFQAHLRLPSDVDTEKKNKHVEEVIKVLGIEHIQDNVVGSPESRGISGGQKKRVNIGMELAAMPAVVFMDEPTSGLDGAATLELAMCLVDLQKAGLTICCVIHQPRVSVFKAFSHLLLLGKGGQQVYCGRTVLMKGYLESLNFWMPPDENAADWMIDVVCGLDSAPHYKSLEGPFQEDGRPVKDQEDPDFKAPTDLFALWDKDHKATCMDLTSQWMAGDPLNDVQREKEALQPRCTPNRCLQFCTLLNRIYRQHSNKEFFFVTFGIFVCFSLMYSIGTVEYNYGAIYAKGGMGVLYSLIMASLSRRIFGDEMLIYYRECKTGISCTSYWLSKVLYSGFRGYLLALVYTLAVYYAAIPMQEFGDFLNSNFFLYWYWGGIAMVLSVSFKNQSTVTLMLVMWPMLEGIYDGSIPAITGEIKDQTGPALWLSTLSSGRWIKQLYFCEEMRSLPSHVQKFPQVATVISNKALNADSEACAGEAFLMLALLGTIFRVFTWLVLALMKHAEGGGFFTDILFVISSTLYGWFECCGFVGVTHPDESDVVVQHFDDKQIAAAQSPTSQAQPMATQDEKMEVAVDSL